jgi:type IX secretion system substrate protein
VKLSRLSTLIIALQCYALYCSPQTTNISGIINTYHRVIEIIPAKACIRVSSTVGLTMDENIMIIQMKGATIDMSNTATFGDTISLNRAGNYEIGTICKINGDSLFLFFNLLNSYTIADKVQVVGIPNYANAIVVDTLKAAPWDNTTGTGGVLALSVTDDLTLNSHIYADSAGYRGGPGLLSDGTCSNFFPFNLYFYDPTILNPQGGGSKGEAVVDLAVAVSGGRGAPANGGGGGNNHNNGGSGGANLSAGGKGGGNYSSTGCSTTILGDGGKPLKNWSGEKIFMGGGGGAGHANGSLYYGGGHGGGIIFIYAKRIIGNNKKIMSNGQAGSAAISDGAAGAGAGGTIIMRVTTYSGLLTVEANGGKGGNENDGLNSKRCYGSGGGGSGGAIYFSGALPAITATVTGGARGVNVAPDPLCNPTVPAVAGNIGVITTNYNYRTSFSPSNSCTYALPTQLINFTLTSVQQKVVLKWKVTQPEVIKNFVIERSSGLNRWTAINTVTALERSMLYEYIDSYPPLGHNSYRIKIVGKNYEISYSPIRGIFIGVNNDQFDIFPNPARQTITISGNLTSLREIKLFDVSGKIVFRPEITFATERVEINLPVLPTGIYILQLNEVRKKLVIN